MNSSSWLKTSTKSKLNTINLITSGTSLVENEFIFIIHQLLHMIQVTIVWHVAPSLPYKQKCTFSMWYILCKSNLEVMCYLKWSRINMVHQIKNPDERIIDMSTPLILFHWMVVWSTTITDSNSTFIVFNPILICDDWIYMLQSYLTKQISPMCIMKKPMIIHISCYITRIYDYVEGACNIERYVWGLETPSKNSSFQTPPLLKWGSKQ